LGGRVSTNVHGADFVYYTVSDIARSVEFYRDVPGLTPDSIDEDMGWAEFALPPTTLALGQYGEQMPTSPGGDGATVAVALDDVEAALDAVREAGMTVKMDVVETPVCEMAMVGDPDDNPLMLHRRHDGTHGRRDPLP
jgi:predicted enzyme related to lactoylglutathione lyase